MTQSGSSETVAAPSGSRATRPEPGTAQDTGKGSAADADQRTKPGGVWARLRAGGALAIGQLGAVTALAFYFGWAHTQAFLRHFGLDTSLVQYTTADYVLRSVGASYWPLMALGFLIVVATAIEGRLTAWIRSRDIPGRRRCRRSISSVGFAMLAIAGAGLLQRLDLPESVPTIPLLISAGVGLLAYSSVLSLVDEPSAKVRREIQLVAMVSILVGGIFWAWGSYADSAGGQRAEAVEDELPYRPDVSVYSVDRLAISGRGVDVQSFGEDDSRFHFRYTGLRLLLRSEERYFLVPRGWERGGDAVIILAESESVRLEFWASPAQ